VDDHDGNRRESRRKKTESKHDVTKNSSHRQQARHDINVEHIEQPDVHETSDKHEESKRIVIDRNDNDMGDIRQDTPISARSAPIDDDNLPNHDRRKSSVRFLSPTAHTTSADESTDYNSGNRKSILRRRPSSTSSEHAWINPTENVPSKTPVHADISLSFDSSQVAPTPVEPRIRIVINDREKDTSQSTQYPTLKSRKDIPLPTVQTSRASKSSVFPIDQSHRMPIKTST
jgi:hypothetical protein